MSQYLKCLLKEFWYLMIYKNVFYDYEIKSGFIGGLDFCGYSFMSFNSEVII